MFSKESFLSFVDMHLVPWSWKIGAAIIVFLLGQLAARVLSKLFAQLISHTKLDKILVDFLRSLVRALLMLVTIVAALDQLGVNTNSLIAMIGATGLAIGLSLQNSLQNFAAGFMLLLFRPFKAGDYIEAAGVAGSVESISIFSTKLLTPDNKEVIIPNGAIYSANIVNYSSRAMRRIDMVFGIGYGDDLLLAKKIIVDILEKDNRILKDPKPDVAVGELGSSSVNFVVRPWVHSDDYWPVKFALNETIKLAFDEAGITIPFPQLEVHLPDKKGSKEQV